MSEATTKARAALTTVLEHLKANGIIAFEVDVYDPDNYGRTKVDSIEQAVEVASSAATEHGSQVYVAHVDTPTARLSEIDFYPFEESARDACSGWSCPSQYDDTYGSRSAELGAALEAAIDEGIRVHDGK